MNTQQQTPFDPSRLQAIRGAMDPLAIVGVFLYYVIKDITGVQFSQDTLLWFVAAASAVRTMVASAIDRHMVARQRQLDHERMLELARMNRESATAAIQAGVAARQATELVAAMTNSTTGAASISGIGDAEIK